MTAHRDATAADASVLAEMNLQLIRDSGHRNPMTLSELVARMTTWLCGEYRAVLFEENAEIIGHSRSKPFGAKNE